MEWTEDAINRIRMFWAEGLSTAEIGRRMNISKNAVVGKAHRLALQPRPSPIRREGQVPRAPRRPSVRRVSGPTLPSFAAASADTTSTDITSVGMTSPGTPSPRTPSPGTPSPGTPRPAASSGRGEKAAAPSPVCVASGLAPVPPSQSVRSAPAESPPARVAEAKPVMRPVAVGRSSSRLVSCCWPIGEPGTREFRFCDAAPVTGKPYCGEHAALAYVKVRDRREEAA